MCRGRHIWCCCEHTANGARTSTMKRTKKAEAFVEAVGSNVRRERERRRMSQAALGAKLETTHSVISRIESAERDMRLSELSEVSRALGTTPAALVATEAQ